MRHARTWMLTTAALAVMLAGSAAAQPLDDDELPPPPDMLEGGGGGGGGFGMRGGGGPGGGFGMRGGAGGGPDGEIEEVMGAFKGHPKMLRRMRQMRRQRPQEFRRKMMGMRAGMRDPKLRKLMIRQLKMEQETHELAHAYRQEKDKGEKEKIKAKLQKLLEDQFDDKMKLHGERLKHMEEQIKKMKERISKRKKLRKEIIEKHLGQMLGEEDDLAW